jgi:hypothetical protein
MIGVPGGCYWPCAYWEQVGVVRMNKTLEAMLRGYLFFRVNNKYFATYTPAQRYRKTIESGELFFEGYHIWKRWQGFFYRTERIL